MKRDRLELRRTWDDNIKMGRMEMASGIWIGWSYVRIGSGGVTFYDGHETPGYGAAQSLFYRLADKA